MQLHLNDIDNRRAIDTKSSRRTFYRVISNLGMTFGSIVEDFRIWLMNDTKHICEFKHTFVTTQHNSLQGFYFTEGMIMSIAKPNLSLQYTIDHSSGSDIFGKIPTFREMNVMNTLTSKMFMESIIKADEGSATIDVQLSYKPIKIQVTAGIVAQSRYHADNIAHAWNYRRADGSIYTSRFLLDFQIPSYIIDVLYDKFNIDRRTHRPMLAWLNAHCPHPVFYGMNTFDGKPYFFIQYKVKPIISPNGMSNPQSIKEQNSAEEYWAFTRNFEIDVLVPTMIGISGYIHPEQSVDESDNMDMDVLDVLRNESVIERTLQIRDKHAIGEYYFELDKDDIRETKSGQIISNKIDISSVLGDDPVQIQFQKWGKAKGLSISDLYEFVVSKSITNTPYTRLGKNHSLSQAMDKLNLSLEEYKGFIANNNLLLEDTSGKLYTIADLDIPHLEDDYEHYIKNTDELWFIDLKAKVGDIHRVTLYSSIRLMNQFIMETGITRQEFINHDDMAREYPTGNDQTLNDIQDRY